jgi:hypothetical protein
MRDHVSIAFDVFSYRLFAPPIRHYADILLSKLAPIFDDVDGEQERYAQQVLESPYWGPDDYDRAMDAAYEGSMDHAVEFMQMRSVFLATGVSGLFHLFEKQLYRHLNHEIAREWKATPIDNWKDADDVIRKLTNRYGEQADAAELQRNFDQPDLIELRHVANAVKHGEGKAYRSLQKMSARVVDPDRIEGDWTVGPHSVMSVPLAIEPADVERYRDAVLAFWKTEGTYWAPRSAFG